MNDNRTTQGFDSTSNYQQKASTRNLDDAVLAWQNFSAQNSRGAGSDRLDNTHGSVTRDNAYNSDTYRHNNNRSYRHNSSNYRVQNNNNLYKNYQHDYANNNTRGWQNTQHQYPSQNYERTSYNNGLKYSGHTPTSQMDRTFRSNTSEAVDQWHQAENKEFSADLNENTGGSPYPSTTDDKPNALGITNNTVEVMHTETKSNDDIQRIDEEKSAINAGHWEEAKAEELTKDPTHTELSTFGEPIEMATQSIENPTPTEEPMPVEELAPIDESTKGPETSDNTTPVKETHVDDIAIEGSAPPEAPVNIKDSTAPTEEITTNATTISPTKEAHTDEISTSTELAEESIYVNDIAAPTVDTTTITEEIKSPVEDSITTTVDVPAERYISSEESENIKDGAAPTEDITATVEDTKQPVEDDPTITEDNTEVSEVPTTSTDQPQSDQNSDSEAPNEKQPITATADDDLDAENSPDNKASPFEPMRRIKVYEPIDYPEYVDEPYGMLFYKGRITYDVSFLLQFEDVCLTTTADLSKITSNYKDKLQAAAKSEVHWWEQPRNNNGSSSSRNDSYNNTRRNDYHNSHNSSRNNNDFSQKNKNNYDFSRNSSSSRDSNQWRQHRNPNGVAAKVIVPPVEPTVVPLEKSENRWIPTVVATDGSASTASEVPPVSDLIPQDIIARKVKSLLNKLTIEKFDSISSQIWDFAKQSEKEEDGESVKNVIGLVFDKAVDEPNFATMWAKLCTRMYELMKETGDKIKDVTMQEAPSGAPLFRKYLLNLCQKGFEKGWSVNIPPESEDVMMSDEYYAAVKAKRQGLGLVQFIGELFKLQILTARVMIICLIKLCPDPENAKDDEAETMCKLLTTIGETFDSNPKNKEWLDTYFERMDIMYKSRTLSSRVKFKILDVFDLRKNNWVSKRSGQPAAPTTIAAIHEEAKKSMEEKEKSRPGW